MIRHCRDWVCGASWLGSAVEALSMECILAALSLDATPPDSARIRAAFEQVGCGRRMVRLLRDWSNHYIVTA